MPPPNHWLVQFLRKILSGATSYTRRTIQRWLYVLWSILSRRFQRRTPSDKNSSFTSETIHYELHKADDSTNDNTVCPSKQPRSGSPNIQEIPNISGLATSRNFLHGQNLNTSQMTLESGSARPGPDNGSISSRRSVISAAPPSITRRARSRRSAQLRPYSYGGRSASRSPHGLASASRSNYSLNNYSTTSHPRPLSSRVPSPGVSSAHSSSDNGSYHISIEPESPLSNHTDTSVDNFPNVAVPAGDVALPETVEATLLSNGRIYQTVPEWISRYERNVLIPMTESKYNVQPLQVNFPCEQSLPLEWIPLTHPEGALFFHHQVRNIFTDAYLYDLDVLLHITSFIGQIDDLKSGKPIPSDAELVLEYSEENDEICCGYYFVHHETRSLFWLEEFATDDLLYEIQGLSSAAHLKHEIESQYCSKQRVPRCTIHTRKHWELFPNNYAVSQDIIDEMRETLLYISGDAITSSVSTTPYNFETLSKMLGLLNQVKPGKMHGHSACFVGRLMHTFAHQKFLHFHGQRGARLCRDQSLYENGSPKRSPLITLLSPILFRAPDVHLRALGDIWVDKIIGHVPWIDFMTKLTSDWKEFTLFATVLLNANVAFLAIQSIDTNRPNRSATQLASYTSIVASVGCVILGLLLERQNRTKDRESAQAASVFLSKMLHPAVGLETLAIMYSLPYALLMWGMLAFLIAFSFNCFHDTNIPTRSIVGASAVMICVLIVWCIWAAWESGEDYLLTLLTEVFESCKAALPVSKIQNLKFKRQWPAINAMFHRSSDSTVTVQV